ncbi:hypothetical protein AADX40_15110 [Aeromonas veronii]|uniref:hypothetical protein n=1 Tax=Aeromonas TaxID=642 RepID=UPI0031586D94
MARPDIYIVGQNITKAEAHALKTAKGGPRLVRVAHGIYFSLRTRESDPQPEQDAEVNSLFNLYGLRIACHLLPDSGLTHSTAYYRAPVDGRIFVGGAYSYRKVIADRFGSTDLGIFQSGIATSRDKESVRLVLSDDDLFCPTPFRDALGDYKIPVQTKEMILLTQHESIKKNQDKLLRRPEIEQLSDELIRQYGGTVPMLDRIKHVAIKAGKTNEYERLLKTILSTKS